VVLPILVEQGVEGDGLEIPTVHADTTRCARTCAGGTGGRPLLLVRPMVPCVWPWKCIGPVVRLSHESKG